MALVCFCRTAFLAVLVTSSHCFAQSEQPTIVDDEVLRKAPDAVGKPVAVQLGSGWSLSTRGDATIGMGIRTRAQRSSLAPAGKNNSDDGNINYAKGDVFSRVARGDVTFDLRNAAGYGAVVSGMAWYDYDLEQDGVPHGNNPNGYQPGAALSDSGFARQARFRGVDLLGAYAYGKSDVGLGTLNWRVGRLTLLRDPGFSFVGGLRDLDARNAVASSRPGAQPIEATIPFWGATASWNATRSLTIDGFLQVSQQHSVGAGCGTFFATNDYSPDGCNRVFYSSTLGEQQNTARGLFIPRSDDVKAPDRPDQFGIGVSYLASAIGTRASIFAAHYDSRNGYIGTYKNRGLGPSAGNSYYVEYPGNKDLIALSTATRIPSQGITFINEISLTMRQPLQKNPNLLLAGFLQGTGPYGADARALPPNSQYQGYDRYSVVQIQTGAQKDFGPMLGAARASLGAELGYKHVVGLPSAAVRPYSRSEVDEVCPVAATCTTLDGFVTADAYAYRVRASADFVDVARLGVTLTPSLTFGQDVKGWSFDYQFIQGRKNVRLALDADYGHGLISNVTWATSRGGQWNERRDRDFVLASIGVKY